MACYVEIEQERAVAGRPEEANDCIVDGCREGAGDGFEVRVEGVEDLSLNEVHAGKCTGGKTVCGWGVWSMRCCVRDALFGKIQNWGS